ncbi:MAG: Unknown protein [uncultured Campylobacterales bacterium]|uniref:Uncharacterized protein n=1 Tax=uncultured Campylobacterales bacterium TaxID=352960 RepID=A0A6S6TBD4_9BACT|nr:MAG: Unknown protein [uncultured Campylobacterales bacterium]
MRNFFLFIILSIFLWADEPSAFGAGNLNSVSAYGLDENEKAIVKNKKSIRVLTNKLENLDDELESIKLISKNINSNMIKDTKKSNERELEKLNTLIDNQNKTIEKFSQNYKSALKEISWVVDDINSKFISKNEFEKIINKLNKKIHDLEKKEDKKKEIKQKTKNEITPKVKLDKKENNWELQKKADNLYKKNNLDTLKSISERLISKGFKPAKNNFYLAEVEYKKANYNKAISLYKKSLKIYDQASYAPKLLLHSGIALKKIGQDVQAKKFFEIIVDDFSNSKEAIEVQKYL